MDPKDTYEKLFRVALRIRLVEERIIELYPDDKIQSPAKTRRMISTHRVSRSRRQVPLGTQA